MGGTHGWKPTDSTGRHQRVIRQVDGFTILVEARKVSIAKAAVRSKEHFPFGVSGTDESSCSARRFFYTSRISKRWINPFRTWKA